MRAAVMHAFELPLTIETVPDPVCEPDGEDPVRSIRELTGVDGRFAQEGVTVVTPRTTPAP